MYSGQKRDDLRDLHHPTCKETMLWRRVRSSTQARQELILSDISRLLSQKNMGRVGALISKVNRIMGKSVTFLAILSASRATECV
jgi:hypothetical protein